MFIAELVDSVRLWGIEKVFKRYYSYYRAQVTAIEDPEKIHRIKVKVPDLFGDTELPYFAQPKVAHAGKGFGQKFRLDIDDWVFVEFERGDVRGINWYPGWWAVGEMPEDLQKPMNSGWVFKSGQRVIVEEEEGKKRIRIENGDGTAAANMLILDDTSGKETLFLIHPKGSQMQLSNTGVRLFGLDGSYIEIDTDTNIITLLTKDGATISSSKAGITLATSDGKQLVSMTADALNLISQSDVIVTGQNVNINGGNIAFGGAKATFSAVIGENLALLFDTHIHATPVGPSGPPLPPNTAALINANPATAFTCMTVKIRGNI